MTVTRYYNLIFTRDAVGQPILYRLGHDFKVRINIRRANIAEDYGTALIEFSGDADEIGRAIASLQPKGVFTEPIERSDFAMA